MKILFLDFDGVLNSLAFAHSLPAEKRGGILGLDPAAVARVDRICKKTGARVVVSSTWRHGRTRDDLAGILYDHGFRGFVHGLTPDLARISPRGTLQIVPVRGDEIQQWIDDHVDSPIDSFVIIDDDSDMAHLAHRHIKTDFATGLLDEHVERAIAMLNAGAP